MPTYAWTHYALVAAHHGLIAAVSGLLGCLIVRAVQRLFGTWRGHEVRLPEARYGRWALASFAIGVAGAALHWLLYRSAHGGFDTAITWLMALGIAWLAYRALDAEYRRSWKALLGFGIGSLVTAMLVPSTWTRPEVTDWFGQFEMFYLVFAAILVALPASPPPRFGRRPPRRRRRGRGAASGPPEGSMARGEERITTGEIQIKPRS